MSRFDRKPLSFSKSFVNNCSHLLLQRNDLQELFHDLTLESVLSVTGTVFERPENQQNKQMKTGDIEVHIESLEVLNAAKPNLPLFIREFNKAKEGLQMKHRYLALRYPELQRNLRLRSQVIAKMREYLIKECDFVDIETPTLFKKTPGVSTSKMQTT